MKKLNNSEIDKVSGGHDSLQIQQSGDKYNLIQVLGTYDTKKEAEDSVYDNALENIQHKRGHGRTGNPPCGPCGKQRNSGICNMPNPFAGTPDQK